MFCMKQKRFCDLGRCTKLTNKCNMFLNKNTFKKGLVKSIWNNLRKRRQIVFYFIREQ